MFVVGGESLIDLVSDPREPGGIIHMHAHQGGSPYNCSIALAKLGNDTGFLCPISQDGLGSYLLEPLEAAGVKPLLPERVRTPTTLAVVTLNEKREARYEFYRGADRALDRRRLLGALPDELTCYQTGGFCPIVPEDSAIWLEVVRQAMAKGATITIDPNVRPSLIEDPDGYRERLIQFIDLAHVVKVSQEDLEWLNPWLSVEDHAAALLERPNCELVVVTMGERGSQAFTAAGNGRAGIWSPPVFGDTVGAGDCLMAGILAILAEEGNLKPGRLKALDAGALNRVLRFGAVVAGLNCGKKGCNPPTRAEVDAVLASF
jgi:fructokinase